MSQEPKHQLSRVERMLPRPAGGGADTNAILRAVVAWLAEAKRRSQHTERSYRRTTQRFLSWAVRVIPDRGLEVLLDVKPTHIRAWLSTLRCGETSRAQRLAVLRSMFRAIVSDGLRSDNPAREVGVARNLRDRSKHTRAVPPAVVRDALLRIAKTKAGARDRAMVLLMTNHGLRRSEVAGLNCGDVILDVEPSLVLRGKGGRVVRVPLNRSTTMALRAWMRVHQESDPTAPMFVCLVGKSAGERISPDYIYSIVKHLFGAQWSPHCLRARSITDVYTKSGQNASVAQAFARHSNPATTQIYIDADKVKDAGKFAPEYGGESGVSQPGERSPGRENLPGVPGMRKRQPEEPDPEDR